MVLRVVSTTLIPGGYKGVQLLQEESYSNGATMRRTFERASALHSQTKRMTCLSNAESIAIRMFTLPTFYSHLNKKTSQGVWRPFAIYTALLYQGCMVLATTYPVHRTLYRGVGLPLKPFRSDNFFLSAFSSTSMKLEIAKGFADSIITFQSCSYGADISRLSAYPEEEEVLILPFEQFRKTRNCEERQDRISFASTASQPLLHNPSDKGEEEDDMEDH